jgi:uncharacterized protein YecT (DUF1311 family)
LLARAIVVSCAVLPVVSALAACPSGQRGVDLQCDVLIAKEEQALKAVEARTEAYLAKQFSGNGYDEGYAQLAVEQFRAAEKAWAAFRDAHCAYEPLHDGMSIGYDGEVTALCKIEMTTQRRKELEKGLPKGG